MDLMLVCKKEDSQRVLDVARYYGIQADIPRAIIQGSGTFQIRLNREVADGVTKFLEKTLERVKPISATLDPNGPLSATTMAKALGAFLGPRMSNLHRACGSYALVNALCLDGQLSLYDVSLPDIQGDERNEDNSGSDSDNPPVNEPSEPDNSNSPLSSSSGDEVGYANKSETADSLTHDESRPESVH